MRKPQVPLRDTTREFHCHETFFSCTDARGVILGGNQVFRRVSGYPEEELVGQPHNLIRHPDMPRTVFWLLWDYLKKGKPIAALVKNLAKDGQFYWVLALAMPVDDGFLSVRIKPTSGLLPVVEELYRRMRAREMEGEARGENDAVTYAAGAALLTEALKGQGYGSYDDFMQLALLQTELSSRDALLERERHELFAPDSPVEPAEPALVSLLRAATGEARLDAGKLSASYRGLLDLTTLNGKLQESARRITQLTADFNLVSFNIALRASKLGHEGRSIAVIATRLTELSEETSGLVRHLTGRITVVTSRLGAAVFNLAWARLQLEMIVMYGLELQGEVRRGEIAAGTPAWAGRLAMLRRLRQALARTGTQTVQALEGLAQELGQLDARTADLGRIVTSLLVARVGGRIEASSLEEVEAFTDIFADVTRQSDTTQEEFKLITEHLEGLHRHAKDGPQLAQLVRGISARLQAQAERLEQAKEAEPAVIPAAEAVAVPA